MIYIFISAIVILISTLLFRYSCGTIALNRIHMVSFIFYVYFILQSYIGSIIVLLYPNEYFNRLINQIDYDKTKLYVWLALSYMLIAFPIGMISARKVMNIKNVRRLFNQYVDSPIIPSMSNRDTFVRAILYIFSFICVCSVVYTYNYIGGFGNLIKMFSIDSQVKMLILRTEISQEFGGNVIIKNLFGLTLLPILSFVSYSYYCMTKRKGDLLWFGIMFIFTFLFLVHDFQKSPFILYLTGFVFIYILNHGTLSKKTLFFLLGVFLLLFIIVYFLIVKNVEVVYLLSPFKEGLVGRILISEISSLYCHFEYFPKGHDFLGIGSLSNFINVIFDIDGVPRSGRIIMESYAPSWVKQGYGGVFNTIFIGEAWANFGILGVILSPLWTGFIIGCLYYLFLRLPKTPMFLGLFVYFSYRSSIVGGFNDYIYNSKYLTLLFVIFIIIASSKALKIINQNSSEKNIIKL